MAQQYEVTSVGVNPADDRAHRMRSYFIVMSLRVACVVSLFWVRGWWVLLVGLGAVVLPYFAVLIANAVAHNGGNDVDAPTALELTGEPTSVPVDRAEPSTLIVVDAPGERRSQGTEA